MKKLKVIVVSLILVFSITSIYFEFQTSGNGNELYITSDKKQQSEQGIELTDEQLVSLFNVASNYQELLNGSLTVEHNIDFNTIGTYNIKFIANYQEVLCFDDKEDADGKGTGKKDNGSVNEVGTFCQNNADDGEIGDNDRYKYIDKQKEQTAKLEIVEPVQQMQLSVLNNASDYEHTVYNDQQLIAKFEAKVLGNATNQQITVTHEIDFEKPGIYDVTFSSGNLSKTVKYEVIDILPTLELTTEHTIKVGESVDFIEDYKINASEFEDYDLNNYVKIHDSNVDYNTPGTYEVKVSVSDQDGNIVIRKVNLHIVDADSLSAKPLIIRKRGIEYTDQELKQLFVLTANYQLDLNNVVVEHQIDFNEVGEYPVKFTDTSTGLSVTSTYKVVKDIEHSLSIDKICLKLGDEFNVQDYIEAYSSQVGPIEDQMILDTLEIDDSLVNYNSEGTYQVNVKATNSAGEVLNRVLALCLESDPDEEESEVSSEVESEVSSEVKSEVSSEVKSEVSSEVKSEVSSEVKSEASGEVKSEVSSEIKSEVSSEVKSEVSSEVDQEEVDVCFEKVNGEKYKAILSRKISTVVLAPSDYVSDARLRNLFWQPEEAVVIHNIIPSVVGNYAVRFELDDCSYTGTVQVKEQMVIDNEQDLEEYLEENGLNNISKDEIVEGDYVVTVVDEETDKQESHIISYNLANTGSERLSTVYLLLGLITIGGLIIIVRSRS
ncbi:DUF5011 domain-containing protein [Mollicutes bacterium LVI A0075]|nr:DUF5011 domain-containing protein [Mollicutes bacterium LVI A0075]